MTPLTNETISIDRELELLRKIELLVIERDQLQAALKMTAALRHPSVGTGSMNAPDHGRMNSLDWIAGWNACLDALEKAEDERNRAAERCAYGQFGCAGGALCTCALPPLPALDVSK